MIKNERKIGNTVMLVEEASSAATNRQERRYFVRAIVTGKTWQLVQDTSGAFPRYRINGVGTAYETPVKAASAIADMLKGV